jgi:hypothetical protein
MAAVTVMSGNELPDARVSVALSRTQVTWGVPVVTTLHVHPSPVAVTLPRPDGIGSVTVKGPTAVSPPAALDTWRV